MVASKISSSEMRTSDHPGPNTRVSLLHDIAQDFSRHGALEISDVSDYAKASGRSWGFMYEHSSMGP